MPTLNLFTNVPVDAVVTSDILKDATKAVAKIIGKPESVSIPAFIFFPITSFFHSLSFWFFSDDGSLCLLT